MATGGAAAAATGGKTSSVSSSTGGSSSLGSSVPTGGNLSTGGSLPTGGGLSTGGASLTGGTRATGGAAAGGSSGVGGSSAVGGARATGGTPGTGGAALGTGGNTRGGAATGGAASGGSASGGGMSTGGAASGGASGFDPCPTTGACKVMPLGDSITDGTGFAGGYRVELFAKTIVDKKNITFVGSLSNGPATVSGVTFPKSHEGHFGWTIAQVDDLIPDPALGPAPHIVLLHLGTNDINTNVATGAPARLGSLIDQIVTRLPNSLIVVAKIIPEPSKASDITTYNNAIPNVVSTRANAGKHVIMVDQFTGFPTSELGDGVHPNQAGYTRMAGVWYTAIKPYLH